ncbi:hypothetical protein ANANG_G00027800 [Anguilla anguilla]|uniref:Uncharacterized protein n=1 Tax=Anguilla anguilla TaxID=7936 RepID=A0A9D3MT58_ANGAN|nr:hypothetical protein ANANG_G00027800 [Anguilla anguilla]
MGCLWCGGNTVHCGAGVLGVWVLCVELWWQRLCNRKDVAGELVEGDATEHYDDVITMQPSPDAFPGESVLDESPPAPRGMDYDDVGE